MKNGGLTKVVSSLKLPSAVMSDSSNYTSFLNPSRLVCLVMMKRKDELKLFPRRYIVKRQNPNANVPILRQNSIESSDIQ